MGGATNEKALGEKLQLARKRAGLTQQELCHKASLSYSTLAKIERGAIKTPSVFTVAAIAEATGTPMEELLGLKSRPSIPTEPKKTSKTGVKFIYFDINGVLVHFFQRAFTQIAKAANRPADLIETTYWRYNDALNRGTMSMREFNAKLGKEYGLKDFDWQKYYMSSIEKVPGTDKLMQWAGTHYEIGLLTNSGPGVVDELKKGGFIPDAPYTATADSSKIGATKPESRIYEAAAQLAAVKPKEILLVDNERPNLTAADRLGWHVLWFDDYHPEDSINRIKKALVF
jgi:FMN phosphatase YigB (HAD superfamily)/DNA-binding XRE family transcriptional regulator